MALALDPDTNNTFMGDTVPGTQDGDCCITPKRTSSLAFSELTSERKCAESLQPRIGMEFDSWEDGKAFYERYAHEVGFSVRTYTQHKGEGGVPVWKRFVCAREGWRKKKDIVNGLVKKPKRNVKLTRCGCEAMIGFRRRDDGKYEVARFVQPHKHLLVSSSMKQFLKSNVEVTSDTRRRRQKASVKQDSQNNCHDFKVIVEDMDAQTIIDTMKSKQRISPSFFFDYQIDDKNKLAHIFWADGTSRKNYALFGDVVFFDSTYRTNHDDLIFAPFTGVNHHKSLVTFGAAFIANEKIESYAWLFKTFLEAMGGIAPKLIITNEDLYVKAAIRDSCPNTVHKLSMWHILNELPVCVQNSNEDDFQSHLRVCVGSSETPDEFEAEWSSIVSKFGLENNAWLTSRFEIRQLWVPAYFLGIHLGGICKTTSRPEGESTFFGHIRSRRLALLELWLRLETDLGEQRRKELEDDNTTLHTLPVLETSWSIEMHARDVYTHTIFSLFQAEVIAARDECDVQNIEQTGEVRTTSISDGSGKIREVIYNTCSKVAQCSCVLFESVGIPCSHIIIVLKREKINEIPRHYVLERWTKLATQKVVLNAIANGHVLEGPRTFLPPVIKQLCSETCSKFNTGMIAARQCEEKMKYLHRAVDDAVDHVLNMGQVSENSKVQEVESFAGITFSEDINVHPPDTAGIQQNENRFW